VAIVPNLPSVAVRLLIKKSAPEYGMLDFIRKFSSVVKDTCEYEKRERSDRFDQREHYHSR
jgi:hypothetical protein